MSTNYIPDELVVEILFRLPAKPLLRFMSVSKSWYSLIKNPGFINDHFNHQINKEPKYLLYCNLDYDYYVYSDDKNFDMHLEFIDNYYALKYNEIACCNGIICFMKRRAHRNVKDISFVLWNSSLRKSLHLKAPHVPLNNGEHVACWFGFDEVSFDYKLVWVGYSWHVSMEMRSFSVYIYSFNERDWKRITSSFSFNDYGFFNFSGVYLNGVIHWVFYRHFQHGYMTEVILTFSLEDETFGVCNLPSEIVHGEQDYNHHVTLMTMKRGCKNCLVAVHGDLTKLNYWVMEEEGKQESWVKDFSIDRSGTKILNARMNGEIVMEPEGGGLVSFDHKLSRMNPLSSTNLLYVGTYMESLVLLL